VSRTIFVHDISVKFLNFVVYKLVDICLGYGSCYGGCAGGSVFRKFIRFFVAPETGVGCDPSQLHLVVSSDLVENVEAVFDCVVLGNKGCERVDGRETICPYDDVFVGIVGELSAGIGNGCKFSLIHCAGVGEVERVFVYDRVVIIGSNNIPCATAFFGFGSVCVAGYPVFWCFIDDVLELCPISIRVVSWCCSGEVALEIE